MDLVKTFFLTLFLSLTSACGSDRVTLTVIPGNQLLKNSRNLLKEITAIQATQVSVGAFCAQPPSHYAAFISDSNGGPDTFFGSTPSQMRTNFSVPAGTNPVGESEIANVLSNSANTVYDKTITLTVPRATEMKIGMIGVANLGGPASQECAVGDVEEWGHVSLSGSKVIQSSTDTTVFLPINVARRQGEITVDTSGFLASGSVPTLNSESGKNGFIIVWIKALSPFVGGFQTGFSAGSILSNLSVTISPDASDPNFKVPFSLLTANVPLSFGTPADIPSGAPAITPSMSTTYTGFLVPQVYPMIFSYKFNGTDGGVNFSRLCSFTLTNNTSSAFVERRNYSFSPSVGASIQAMIISIDTTLASTNFISCVDI